jgi:4-amino-4-deoxy-L-arabinose transferase-like glycosyltransferase
LGFLLAAFKGRSGIDRPLVLAFVAIQALVLANALLHDPEVGYDARQHLKYVATLSKGRLPQRADSSEFFSPPVPYVIPAVAMRVLGLDGAGAGKVAQLANVVLSLGIVLLMLLLCEEISPGGSALKRGALLLLALETVYYKTLCFVRGEPYVAFFSLLAVLLASRAPKKGGGGLGGLATALALLFLSRQWGLFVLGGLLASALLLFLRKRDPRPLGVVVLCGLVGAALAAPFYLHLRSIEGTPLAFNRGGARGLSLGNETGRFYFGLGDGRLFTEPLRPNFPNELIPIFYSETWGDYWEFFLVYAKKGGTYLAGRELEEGARGSLPGVATNRQEMAAFLGRVNALSLAPSVVLLAGLVFGLRAAFRPRSGGENALGALALVVLVSASGYLVFLVRFPELERGDTIKATYLLHVFPMLSILGSAALEGRMRLRSALVVLWALVFIHDLPAFVTRHF